MGLDVWFREDVLNALLAADQASAATVAAVGNDVLDPATVRAFRQGFRAALVTVALAFGIAPEVDDGPGQAVSRIVQEE